MLGYIFLILERSSIDLKYSFKINVSSFLGNVEVGLVWLVGITAGEALKFEVVSSPKRKIRLAVVCLSQSVIWCLSVREIS